MTKWLRLRPDGWVFSLYKVWWRCAASASLCVCVSADVSARNQCRVSNKQKAMLNGAISLFFVSAFRSLLCVHTSE
jgi:hypothetical protein